MIGIVCIVLAGTCGGGAGSGAAYDGSATGGSGWPAAGGAGGQSTSPGTVSVKVTIAPGASFCDADACGPATHVWFSDPGGTYINTAPPFCRAACAVGCVQPPCPGFACPMIGLAYTGEQRTWNGVYYQQSTCGAAVECYQQRFVQAGRYVASVCATPGIQTGPDSGVNPTCTKTGERQCAKVTFDFPASAPVELTLGR